MSLLSLRALNVLSKTENISDNLRKIEGVERLMECLRYEQTPVEIRQMALRTVCNLEITDNKRVWNREG